VARASRASGGRLIAFLRISSSSGDMRKFYSLLKPPRLELWNDSKGTPGAGLKTEPENWVRGTGYRALGTRYCSFNNLAPPNPPNPH
jgi:hypothetical protein